MKNNVKLISILGVGAVLALLVSEYKKNPIPTVTQKETVTALNSPTQQKKNEPESITQPNSIQETSTKTQSSPNHRAKNEEKIDFRQTPLSSLEISSVQNITKTISRTLGQKMNSNQFMKAVQALGLKPRSMDQGTQALGSMVTVRTEDSLEGTRYLHAQFTGEKNKADLLQHVSFQIRPGQNSFQKAVEILNEVLPKNKILKESGTDYVLFNTADGYVAWAKIATREDLKSNKYNASSKEDVGSIIVTIEQEIHDMDEND